MGGQIVHDDDVAGFERRHQDLLDIGEEGDLVHRAVECHRGGDAAEAQGADEGGGLPVAVRDRSTAAFASLCPAVHPRHLGRRSRLIDEDQPLGIEIGLGLEPGFALRSYIFAVLLGRVRRLFWRVTP